MGKGKDRFHCDFRMKHFRGSQLPQIKALVAVAAPTALASAHPAPIPLPGGFCPMALASQGLSGSSC
jgi:hypothetical protein